MVRVNGERLGVETLVATAKLLEADEDRYRKLAIDIRAGRPVEAAEFAAAIRATGRGMAEVAKETEKGGAWARENAER